MSEDVAINVILALVSGNLAMVLWLARRVVTRLDQLEQRCHRLDNRVSVCEVTGGVRNPRV